MSETTHLHLPYLEAAQAQKHVTLNESLRMLDAVVQLSVKSRIETAPPSSPSNGDRYIVKEPSTDDWSGQEDNIAIFEDGAWMFHQAGTGWRAYDENAGGFVFYDGMSWNMEAGGAGIAGLHGAATSFSLIQGDHTLTAGATNETSFTIPDRAIVLGVTGIVIETVTGASAWTLGVAADASRYGSGIGVVADSTVIGVSSTPTAYYGDTALRLTAVGSDFVSGKIRLAIHCLELAGPVV